MDGRRDEGEGLTRRWAVDQLGNKHGMVKSFKEYQWSICTFPGVYSCPQKWLFISCASASWEKRVLEHESSWACCLGRCPVLCFPLEQTAPAPFPLGQNTHHGISSGVAWSWAEVVLALGYGLEVPCSSWEMCSCMGWKPALSDCQILGKAEKECQDGQFI